MLVVQSRKRSDYYTENGIESDIGSEIEKEGIITGEREWSLMMKEEKEGTDCMMNMAEGTDMRDMREWTEITDIEWVGIDTINMTETEKGKRN